MDNTWTYVAHGPDMVRNTGRTWMSPNPEATAFLQHAYKQLSPEAPGAHIIGFDGKQWLSAHAVSLEDELKAEARGHMDFELPLNSKTTTYLQGHASGVDTLPEHIPPVPSRNYKNLLADTISRDGLFDPLPDFPDNTPMPSPVHTQPAAKIELADIASHLPEDAVAALKEAHGKGEPILLKMDPASRAWEKLEAYTAKGNVTEEAVVETVEKVAEKISKSKLALIGSAVGLGAVGALWLVKQRNKDTHTTEMLAVMPESSPLGR